MYWASWNSLNLTWIIVRCINHTTISFIGWITIDTSGSRWLVHLQSKINLEYTHTRKEFKSTEHLILTYMSISRNKYFPFPLKVINPSITCRISRWISGCVLTESCWRRGRWVAGPPRRAPGAEVRRRSAGGRAKHSWTYWNKTEQDHCLASRG